MNLFLAGQLALLVDCALGLLIVLLCFLFLLDRATRKVIDHFKAWPILYQYAIDRAGRKEAEKKVKARHTVSEYKAIDPWD